MKKIPYGKVITIGKIREFFAKKEWCGFVWRIGENRFQMGDGIKALKAGSLAFAFIVLRVLSHFKMWMWNN